MLPGGGSYVSYAVVTQTDLPEYGEGRGTFTVRRASASSWPSPTGELLCLVMPELMIVELLGLVIPELA